MRLGIIGLPKCGKTAVFNAVVGPHKERHAPTHAAVQNIAVVKIPDERLDFLKGLFPEKRSTPTTIELLELHGIFPSPWEVSPEAAASVALLREMDAIVEVVRAFPDPDIPHPKGSVDPQRDINDMDQELILNDLLAADKRIEKLKKSITKPSPTQQRDKEEMEILLRCKETLEKNQEITDVSLSPDQKKIIKGFCFLTEKHRIAVVNIGENQIGQELNLSKIDTRARDVVAFCAKLESEMWELEEAERQEFQKEWGIPEPAGPKLLKACYHALDLVSFYTIEGEEMRVWPLPRGETALAAAGKIHSDIARGFIKAEVISLQDLKALGSLKEAKTHGKLHLVGKDYIVQDGDIITFRFHV
jgi:GTP-binding protein YchF